MSELDLRNSPWNEGLSINADYLHHQLYYLGTMFYSSPVVDNIKSISLSNLRQQFQEEEIGRVLLVIAAAVRNDMDQNPGRSAYWLDGTNTIVGSLTLLNSRQTHDLHFREACNKIIHCLSINFHYLHEKPKKGYALKPKVHVYGTKGKSEWKATIEISHFIDVAYDLI